MLKYLLAMLIAPQLVQAQEAVQPVISKDYLSLINNDSVINKKRDTAGSKKNHLLLKQPYTYSFPVKRVTIHGESVNIIPAKTTYLKLGGNYTSAFAIKTITAVPLLQNDYVQGESVNSALTWQGPETNEMFSYGPAVSSLEYDGSLYPYDINGRLVKAGAGDGKKAAAYNNNIFRKDYTLTNSLSLLGTISSNYTPDWSFSLKGSSSNENTVIQNNNNTDNSFSASLERNFKTITIAGAYNYFISRFSNDNSNGFLNRVYENALLTPPSFYNAQGYAFANGNQRSYSNDADNPAFLLKDNGHLFKRTQQTANVSIQKKKGYFTYGTVSSADAVTENSNQTLKSSTAFFPLGLPYDRIQNYRHYTITTYAAYDVRYSNYLYRSTAKVNYVFNNDKVNITYLPAGTYNNYQRSSNDVSVAYNSTYNGRYVEAGLNAGNKFYQSSTYSQGKFALPDVSGFIRFPISDYDNLWMSLSSNYTSFYSEPAINGSYSPYMLTQLAPQDAYKFMPVTEVQSFNNIQAAQHNEFSSKIEISRYWLSLTAEMFIRKTNGDVFPIYENGVLSLKNLADHRLNGFEIQLNINRYQNYRRDFSFSNSVSFYKWNSMVTRIENGYNNTPIAGFANVYKAIVTGKPLGVIMGNSYLRDVNNKIIIGNDGFPLVNTQLSVIGNPVPDFTLKFSHIINWKKITVNIDWEYKKGGDVWNGTQALLDYYGRSQATGVERNITSYIFTGVSQDGRPNGVAVNFYDASMPVEKNRWARYGYTGVAESYIQKGDAMRIHNLSIAYTVNYKKYLQKIRFIAYAENLMLWSAYKGADPNQLLYGQPASSGLDFFNLPSTKNFGINVSFQF